VARLSQLEILRVTDANHEQWSHIVETLMPFIKESRVARLKKVLAQRRSGLHLVLENIGDPYDQAAVLRTAEGLGVQHVHLIESENKHVTQTRAARSATRSARSNVAMGAVRWLTVRRYKSAHECLHYLRGIGAMILCSSRSLQSPPEIDNACGEELLQSQPSPTSRSQSFERPSYAFGADNRRPDGASTIKQMELKQLAAGKMVALVFGNERRGVSRLIAEEANATFFVPMSGFTPSLSISVAASVSLYGAIASGAFPEGSLTHEEQTALLGQWLLRDVKAAKMLLRRNGYDIIIDK